MKQIFFDIRMSFPIIFVSALTLLLLTYVGSWEAGHQYSVFQASKLATQGEIITNSVESYLQAGLPVTQYSGFQQLSETLMESDESIEHLSVFNKSNQLVFFNQHYSLSHKQKVLKEKTTLFQQELSQRQYKLSDIKLHHQKYLIEESDTSLKLTLPLNSKFGKAGFLVIESDKTSMFLIFEKKYRDVFIAYGFIILFFGLFTIIYEHFFRHSRYKQSIFKTVYALSFFAMSGVIFAIAFQIYEQGAQANTKALTDSMVARLNSVLELGIKIEDISGINETFTKYKTSNPDIREIALIEDGMCKYHTEPELIGKQHTVQDDVYEYLVELKSKDKLNRELFVSVSLPMNIVHKAVLSSANEFITLMIACGLISLIFIDAGTGMSSVLTRNGGHSDNKINAKTAQNKNTQDFRLELRMIKPAYFLIVFVHALSISFLPNMVTHLADVSGSSFATQSLPFTLYYALFALVLIPAGQYAERGSLKLIMAAGCLFELLGLTLISITSDYWLLVLARAFSGAGQGFFLIGLQSYLLIVTPREQRTQGAAVKVIGRNAGLIAGTSIGALIFSFTDYTTVFMIGSALSILGMFYLWLLVPEEHLIQAQSISPKETKQKKPLITLINNIIIVFKDAEFVKSLLLVAIPGKMAITGVIMFAVPLLLTAHGFGSGEVGQALMLYYIASIFMTHYISRLVDHLDMSRFVLFISTIIGGISIIILGFSDVNEWNGGLIWLGGEQITQIAIAFNQILAQTQIQWLPTAVIIISLILAGISNGLLTSPVITHINKTKIAEKHGVKSVTVTYSFLERGGHILGPLSIGYLLTLALQSNVALSLFGIIILFLGIIFIFVARKI